MSIPCVGVIEGLQKMRKIRYGHSHRYKIPTTYGREDPSYNDKTHGDVGNNPPGDNKRRLKIGYNGSPVKRQGKQTETVSSTGDLSQSTVLGRDPAGPGEHGQYGEEVAWNPVVNEHGSKAIEEPSETSWTAPVLVHNVERAEE